MPKRILIAEDEADLIFLMKQMLEVSGYEVMEAHDGKQAQETAREQMPDLIIMDIMMPNVDGYTATVNIRQDEKTKNIPILLSTAKGQMRPLFSGNVKIQGYLEKPFNLKALIAEVKKLLGE